MPPVLQAHGLSKRYGDLWALDGLDISVGRGEVFGFLGPNGAGKTTFTKCATGFIHPSRGRVEVMGVDVHREPTRVAAHVGLVPDQYDFYANLSGRQHLDFYGRLHGMGTEDRSARIAEVLETVRMEERADDRVKGYSHGMKQRICIAQAILHDPELILFDEPTNGLDPKGAYELREMIRGLAGGGTTVFLNSHLLHEVEQVCERVAILNRGRVLKVGSIADLGRDVGGAETVAVRLLNPLKKYVSAAKKAGAGAPQLDGDQLRFEAGDEATAEVVSAVAAAGGRVVEVQRRRGSLEDVFLRLTAEEGADPDAAGIAGPPGVDA